MTAVGMFGMQFLVNQKFARHTGGGARAALRFQLGCNLSGLAVLAAVIFFRTGRLAPGGFSAFTVGMAALSACNSILYTFCSLRALGRINLSLYSVFSMLGGMLLPFLLGVGVFHETLSAGKLVSVFCIALALAVTVRGGAARADALYCAGLFLLNGMSGVISKLYQAAPYPKADEYGFLFTAAAASAVLSAAALLFLRGFPKTDARSVGVMALSGTLSYGANLLLLIALSHVPASAQYPLVTGGVMAASTLLSYFTETKPSARELLSVGIAVLGIFAMVLL